MRNITESSNYSPTELVVVAGHATYKNELVGAPEDPTDEANWVLQSFQKGEVRFYIDHMRAGVLRVAANPHSYGLVSGGRTRLEGGRWGEATTYEAVAEHYGYWQDPDSRATVRSRFGTERFARDSFENVWFSLMAFYGHFDKLPESLVVKGWPAKAQRFMHHAAILGVPTEVFSYEGVEDPPNLEGFAKGEKTAQDQWQADPIGLLPPLSSKRLDRDPFQLGHPYGTLQDYVDVAHAAGWQPSETLLGAAALIGNAA